MNVSKNATKAMQDFLEALHIDLEKQGMEKTPERVASFYGEFFKERNIDSKDIWGETFTSDSEGIVAVQHIPFYSMCEHHLVPFFGKVSIDNFT